MSTLSALDLAGLFGHFVVLSLLAVGGAITTAPDMQRYLVRERGWIGDGEFTASVALAQAAPGPNVLFVAVLGWNVAGAAGAAVTLAGIMLPSTTLALWATRWGSRRRETLGVRAFTAGLAPLTIGLLLATGWVLTDPARGQPRLLALVALTAVVMLRWRVSPLWLVGAGMIAGALGWV
ncbi:MAG: chromate transporter [Ideonella sp.]|nr:chromate transporter [Ideonella sp.]